METLFHKGDLHIIKTAFSPDYVAYASNKEFEEHNFLKKFAEQLCTALPKIKVTKLEFLAEDGDSNPKHFERL